MSPVPEVPALTPVYDDRHRRFESAVDSSPKPAIYAVSANNTRSVQENEYSKELAFKVAATAALVFITLGSIAALIATIPTAGAVIVVPLAMVALGMTIGTGFMVRELFAVYNRPINFNV